MDFKDIILRLRSGEVLNYRDGYLLSTRGDNVALLSNAGKEKLKYWEDKGYVVTGAKVSYVLAWRPKDAVNDLAVCLANIVLTRKEE